MADLVTKLRLNDREFDRKIKKNKQQLTYFKKIGEGVSGSIKSLGMQFVAAAGLCEIFGTAINSNKILQDKYNDAITAAKISVDNFFTALTTGNWSIFENGIMNAIKLSKKYAKSMREVETSIQFADLTLTKNEKVADENERIINDPKSSYKEKEDAYKKFTSNMRESIHDIQEVKKYNEKALNDLLNAKGIKTDKNTVQFILDNLNPNKAGYHILDEYKQLKNKLSHEITNLNNIKPTNSIGAKMYEKQLKKVDSIKKQIADFETKHKEVKKAYDIDVKVGGKESLTEIINKIKTIYDYEQRLEAMKRQQQDVDKNFDENGKYIKDDETGTTTTTVKTVKVVADDASIQYLDEQISQVNTAIKLAVDNDSRVALNTELKSLEDRKRYIIFQYKFAGGVTPDDLPPIQPPKLQIPKTEIPNFNDKIKPIKNNDVSKNMKDNADSVSLYASALDSCAAAISTFNGAKLEDTSEGWTQWSTNLLAAAASTIIGLQSLTMAKGVNSAFDLPFPANLAAAAMVLSTVISLFASIPAFAEGGIVNSSFTSGDKNLVRVNGGEMILTTAQQGNLFNMLNYGNPSPNQANTVNFRIEGKQLVGVLNNYNNKMKKIL